MGKHDVRNILLGGGILAALYFLFGGTFKWPPANGGNGGNGGNGDGTPPSDEMPIPPPTGWDFNSVDWLTKLYVYDAVYARRISSGSITTYRRFSLSEMRLDWPNASKVLFYFATATWNMKIQYMSYDRFDLMPAIDEYWALQGQ